jgi:PAS domain-containing protein
VQLLQQGLARFHRPASPHELGLGWTRGLHPDDYQRCVETFNAAHCGRLPFTMDYHLRRHDGAYRWILSNGVPYYEAGAFAGFLGSCIDISEHQGAADEEAEAAQGRPEGVSPPCAS